MQVDLNKHRFFSPSISLFHIIGVRRVNADNIDCIKGTRSLNLVVIIEQI